AVGVDILGRLGRQGQVIGASTLATQLEKFRHSPEGRTRSAGDKFRQMVSASLRAYQGGRHTLTARRQIVVDYLNSLPLAAALGRGEILGLGDGLWAWYGMDFDETNHLLAADAAPADAARAQAYRRTLSLLLAARRHRAGGSEPDVAVPAGPGRSAGAGPQGLSPAGARRSVPGDLQLHALRAQRRGQPGADPDGQPRSAAGHQCRREARPGLHRQ